MCLYKISFTNSASENSMYLTCSYKMKPTALEFFEKICELVAIKDYNTVFIVICCLYLKLKQQLNRVYSCLRQHWQYLFS